METIDRNLLTARLLNRVYDGAYSSLELSAALRGLDPRDAAYVSNLFYGVLRYDTLLEYILSRLTDRRPKPKVATVIKMGIYMLRNMRVADYAAVDAQVEVIKKLGKRELAGFVNAVLRRSGEVELPVSLGDEAKDISVNLSCPLWIVKKLIRNYNADFARAFLSAELPTLTHVRVNENAISRTDFAALLSDTAQPSKVGFFVSHADLANIKPEYFVVQSLSSVLAAEYYAVGVTPETEVLDLCAAPGGKAVYMAERTRQVTACDIHPHRVELIRSYAERLKIKNLTAEVNDATVRRDDFVARFGCVICDVPCSGVGVLHSKPDILLNKKPENIAELSALQYAILSTAADYVAEGGQLNYSTCTVFTDENERVIERFLADRPDFALTAAASEAVSAGADGYVRLYPHTNGCDGFFVAKLRRTRV